MDNLDIEMAMGKILREAKDTAERIMSSGDNDYARIYSDDAQNLMECDINGKLSQRLNDKSISKKRLAEYHDAAENARKNISEHRDLQESFYTLAAVNRLLDSDADIINSQGIGSIML